MTNIDTLVKGLNELKIEYDKEVIDRFRKYKELLGEWNKKINITSITEDKEVDIKHFLDSVVILQAGAIKGRDKIIDVGTGGGFPGIPLKIIRKDIDLVLLDSLNKRIKFLDEVVHTLALTEVSTIHGRSEDYGRDEAYREKFDIAVSRAVAPLNVLAEYCLPFVKIGGYFLAMKGPEVNNEIEEGKEAIHVLGGETEEKLKISLPFTNITHTLVVIRKTTKTPTKYPRKAGKPTKNPL